MNSIHTDNIYKSYMKNFFMKKGLYLFFSLFAYFSYVIATIFIQAKPYYYFFVDCESGYYYFIQMVENNKVFFHPHPGTLVVYALWLFWKFISLFSQNIQYFFNSLYLFLMALNFIILRWTYTQFSESKQRPIFLATIIITSFPSFIYFSCFFSTDSLYLIITLPFYILIWKRFSFDKKINYLEMLFFGGYAGFLTATKFNHAPLAFISLLSISIYQSRVTKIHHGAICFLILTFFASSGFLIYLAPVIDQVPIQLTYILGYGSTPGGNALHFSAFFSQPALIFTLSIILIALIFFIIDINKNTPEYIVWILGISIVLIYLCFKAASNSNGYLHPCYLRHTIPYILVILPLLLNFHLHHSHLFKKIFPWLLFSSLAILISTISIIYSDNEDLMRKAVLRDDALNRLCENEFGENYRVAVWDGFHNGIGPSRFHLWGNYRYGRGCFDQDLFLKYPKWSLFDYRQAQLTAPNNTETNHIKSSFTLDVPFKKTFYGIWHRFFPLNKDIFKIGKGNICTGPLDQEIDGIVIFLDQDEVLNSYSDDNLKIIMKLVGLRNKKKITISGRPIVFLSKY